LLILNQIDAAWVCPVVTPVKIGYGRYDGSSHNSPWP